MKRLLSSKWTYVTMRIVGFCLLFVYLWQSGDWRLSVPWALAFPAISFGVGWTFVSLRFFERFPRLNTYLLYPANELANESTLSEDEWALRQAKYLESGMRGVLILTAPAEDGFICVPVLLSAITPISALVAGTIFGLMHLARFTQLECIGKAIAYALVVYVVLPHGLLTVVLGHLLMDVLGVAVLKIAQHRLSRRPSL